MRIYESDSRVALNIEALPRGRLYFFTTTRALRSVLGNTIVMVLLCHLSECGCLVCNT